MSLIRELDREAKKKTGEENQTQRENLFLEGTVTLEKDKPCFRK
jgi:hypothetical protein